jgi:hypothetical protein
MGLVAVLLGECKLFGQVRMQRVAYVRT